MVVALSAPVLRDPLVARVPDQPPDAVHAVALRDDQVNVDSPPLATLEGFALSETLGAGAETETVTDCEAVPPAPLQAKVYLVAAVSGAVLWEPLVASAPLQPPEAVHEVALVDDQLRVEVLPLVIVLGLAVSVTAGAGVVTEMAADCCALPPAPLQESV